MANYVRMSGEDAAKHWAWMPRSDGLASSAYSVDYGPVIHLAVIADSCCLHPPALLRGSVAIFTAIQLAFIVRLQCQPAQPLLRYLAAQSLVDVGVDRHLHGDSTLRHCDLPAIPSTREPWPTPALRTSTLPCARTLAPVLPSPATPFRMALPRLSHSYILPRTPPTRASHRRLATTPTTRPTTALKMTKAPLATLQTLTT